MSVTPSRYIFREVEARAKALEHRTQCCIYLHMFSGMPSTTEPALWLMQNSRNHNSILRALTRAVKGLY